MYVYLMYENQLIRCLDWVASIGKNLGPSRVGWVRNYEITEFGPLHGILAQHNTFMALKFAPNMLFTKSGEDLQE